MYVCMYTRGIGLTWSVDSTPIYKGDWSIIVTMAKIDSSQFLSTIIGQNVHVKLHSGMLYRGRLESIDGFMNVALSSAKEHYETGENGLLRTYPTDVFLRGTQVMYISEVK